MTKLPQAATRRMLGTTSINLLKNRPVLLCLEIALLLVLCAVALRLSGSFGFMRAEYGAGMFGTLDFIEYWSSYQLFSSGNNPYDAQKMLQVQHSIGSQANEPLMMWNPPWIHTIFAFAFKQSFPASARSWFLLNVVLVLLGGLACCSAFGITRRGMVWGIACTVFFYPIWHSLRLGQLGAVLFFGAALLLYGLQKKRYLTAGLGALLVSLKPHIFYLWILLGAFWLLREKRLRAALQVCVPLAAIIAFQAIMYPESLASWYQSFMQRPNSNVTLVAQWKTAGLVTLVRDLFAQDGMVPLWPTVVVPGVAALLFLTFFMRKDGAIDWLACVPPLLCVSCFSAPYGWVFDFSVLAITQLSAAQMLVRSKSYLRYLFMALFIVLQIGTAYFSGRVFLYHHQYWWYPLVLLLLWYFSHRLASKSGTISYCGD